VALAQNQGKIVRVGELNKPYVVWGTQFRLGTVCGEASPIRLRERGQSINVQIHPYLGIRNSPTSEIIPTPVAFLKPEGKSCISPSIDEQGTGSTGSNSGMVCGIISGMAEL